MNNKWWIFLGGVLIIFLVNIDATIVNLALASIAKTFHTNLAQAQWVINSYLLTATIFFIIGGKISDIIGQKKVYLLGTILFAISSLFAGLAPNLSILIFTRLCQGIGLAFTLSLALLMISNAFPKNQRGFVLGLSVTITGLGLATGPTLGGAILDMLNWHWIFLINVPIAGLSFIIIFISYNSKKPIVNDKIDYLGALFFGIALASFLTTLNTLASLQLNFFLLVLGLLISVIFFVLFLYRELKVEFPLINFDLFSRRNYSLSIVIRFLFMYTHGTFLFFVPLYLQNILEFSPLFAGLIILVYSSVFAISSPLAGILCDQIGYKNPIVVSSIIGSLSFFVLLFIGPSHTLYLTLLGLALFGVSGGIFIPSTVNSTISSLPKEKAGEGIGIFYTVAFLGTSLGVISSGTLMSLTTNHLLLVNLNPNILKLLKPAQLDLLHRVANGIQPLSKLKDIFNQNNLEIITKITHYSFEKGFINIMLCNFALLILVTILSIYMKKPQIKPSKLKFSKKISVPPTTEA